MRQRLDELVRWLERGKPLDPVAGSLARAVRQVTSEPVLERLLSGAWLGHPVHPPLTDVPVGMFVGAAVLDVLPGGWSHRSADVLIGTGLLTALPTAVTGLNDFAEKTSGGSRRVAMVHALTNSAAAGLYAWSLFKRLKGQRVRGVTLSFLGLGTLTFGAYLGGHLTYRQAVGVDEAGPDGRARTTQSTPAGPRGVVREAPGETAHERVRDLTREPSTDATVTGPSGTGMRQPPPRWSAQS